MPYRALFYYVMVFMIASTLETREKKIGSIPLTIALVYLNFSISLIISKFGSKVGMYKIIVAIKITKTNH